MRITGTVQGVGFRPFVYRHAIELGLVGYVLNDSAGVLIEVEGPADRIDELTRRLVQQPPPLARVAAVECERLAPSGTATQFRIVESEAKGRADVPVSIDTCTCADCLTEMDDPSDRRTGYAFTNCTNCGPRYTIVLGVPYDRPATTMAKFTMCADCQAEYDDPADRRFHAQPNACPACGPQLAWFDTASGTASRGAAALESTVQALVAGQVIAVKGIGGYHLVADATDAGAVASLRRRKSRDDKPFALMVGSLAAAHEVCVLDDDAAEVLSSIRRPIVLAPRTGRGGIAESVAPGLPELGVMLPYSPLHHLLLARLARPLVMTSGNLSDEPIAHHDDDAHQRLGPLVDGILHHDRPIHIRCDDSVVRATGLGPQVLRRSRGYAPERLSLPFDTDRQVLALGAELKNTISVAKHDWVVPSHHIGDLEHLATYRAFLQAVEHVPRLYGVVADVVAHDLHPEYLSTKLAGELDVATVAVQHHHAHVAACMVEHDRVEPVLGVAFDGLGYGPDGTLWGGELLVADFASARRVGHLRPVRMPGGTAAIREPWRMAIAWAALAGGSDVAARWARAVGIDDVTAMTMLSLIEHPASPVTTGVGRLFDAVAALLGCRQRVSYEAQGAIELEALARSAQPAGGADLAPPELVIGSDGVVLDPGPLVASIVRALANGVDRNAVAAGFHRTLAAATIDFVAFGAAEHGLDTVVLTGGVFQNALLSEQVAVGIRALGLDVLTHGAIPPNDGGISVGQAAIAAFQTRV